MEANDPTILEPVHQCRHFALLRAASTAGQPWNMGAALAGFISAVPWITAISAYKVPLFIVAGLLLAMAGVMQWRARHAPCPADPAQAKACMRLRMISWIIWAVAAFLYDRLFLCFCGGVRVF